MQFSLGPNPLQNYISTSSKGDSTDSLRTITDLAKLESYFRQRKDATFKSIEKLWKRIEQCQSACMQLSDSVDISYSRINQDTRSLNIERYEDLLPYSFKEVEWTRSSRVAVATDNGDKVKMVEKYQNQVNYLQNHLGEIQKDQERMLGELESNITQLCKQHQILLTDRQKVYRESIGTLQQKISQVESELTHSQRALECDFQGFYKSLLSSITSKIGELQEQIQALQK